MTAGLRRREASVERRTKQNTDNMNVTGEKQQLRWLNNSPPFYGTQEFITAFTETDRLCGLVVKEFLATDFEVPGSIPGPSRFSGSTQPRQVN
jgi:hypothetical protein